MESERENHLARIYQLIDELERSDPAERAVIDLVVERKMRQARVLWRLKRLSQGPRPGQARDEDE